MTPIAMVLLGPPRTKKNHSQIVRAGGRPVVMPSPAYRQWERIALPQARSQFRDAGAPIAGPVNVRATFYRERRVGDAVGFYQALADLLEKAGVVEDDKWICAWDGSRLAVDAERPRVELTIEELRQ